MSNNYLASKPRYEILDGLRGVAAILVVCFHLFETYSAGIPYQIINHGYLAVDFFFILSGFVVGYAYDERLASGKMTTWDHSLSSYLHADGLERDSSGRPSRSAHLRCYQHLLHCHRHGLGFVPTI